MLLLPIRRTGDAALGRLANASLLTFSADDSTVAAHRLTLRVARELQAQERSLARLGLGIAGLLSVVTGSLKSRGRIGPQPAMPPPDHGSARASRAPSGRG
jgi:hypothetical protein